MKKVFYLLLLIFLIVLGYLAYPRIFNETPETKKISPKSASEQNKANQEDIPAENKETPPLEGEIKSDSLNITITPADCDNECSKFQDYDEQKYCEQICGISDLYDYENEETEENASEDEEDIDTEEDENAESEEESAPDCEKKSGLEKDYCLKDQAIEEEDFEICDKIKDTGIQKTCRNRITEDLMEEQAL